MEIVAVCLPDNSYYRGIDLTGNSIHHIEINWFLLRENMLIRTYNSKDSDICYMLIILVECQPVEIFKKNFYYFEVYERTVYQLLDFMIELQGSNVQPLFCRSASGSIREVVWREMLCVKVLMVCVERECSGRYGFQSFTSVYSEAAGLFLIYTVLFVHVECSILMSSPIIYQGSKRFI